MTYVVAMLALQRKDVPAAAVRAHVPVVQMDDESAVTPFR